MKIKTLLLGTATAFVMAGGAQAADLAVAEPVDYVKVCDAYGAGYWYIPGTDTCLKIGGYVKLTAGIYDHDADRDYGSDYSSSWDFVTETSIQVTAQSMTDIGLLTGFLEYRVNTDNSAERSQSGVGGGKNLANLDSAYVKAGPIKLGYFTSIYMYGGDFTEIGVGADYDAADFTQDQVAFSTSFGGIGFWLGLGDPRDDSSDAGDYTGDFPDIVAALTGTAGGFDWKWSGVVTDTVFGTGWATQLGGTYTFAGGDAIRIKGAVGNSEAMPYINALGPLDEDGTWWQAFIAGIHYWNSNVATELVGEYTTGDSGDIWQIGTETNWVVAKGFLTGIAVNYTDGSALSDSSLRVQLVGKRSW